MKYDNKNKGVLFKNSHKTQPNHPDYKGKININGVDHELAGWLKDYKGDRKLLSLSIGKKLEPRDDEDVDPNIPF